MTAGQAGIASEMYPVLGDLLDRVADDDERRRVIGAMRVARWWSIACERLDKAEAATADAGGFNISIEAAPALEAFNADLVSYYIFGSMVLDRLATVAGAHPCSGSTASSRSR